MALLVIGVAAVAVVQAQGKPSVDTSMTELVAEVRALRLAVERSGTLTARTQAMLGRVQLQENRLSTLGRDLQESRLRTRDQLVRQGQLDGEIERLSTAVDTLALGSDERRNLEASLGLMRREAKLVQALIDTLKTEEAEIGQALAAEQARWSDFNERLEALERELTTPRTPPEP